MSSLKYVSLGCDCATTHFLRKSDFTKEHLITGPFDWSDVPLKALINSLINFSANGGTNYTKLEIIKYDEKYPYYNEKTGSLNENKGSLVIKNRCGVKFAHEVLNAYKFNEFKLVLQKRIERLQGYKHERICFVRYERPMSNKEVNTYFLNLTTVISLLNKIGFNNYSINLLLPERSFSGELDNFDKLIKAGYSIVNINYLTYENVNIYVKTYGGEEDYVYIDWKNEKAFIKMF